MLGQLSKPVSARIDSTLHGMYGPGVRIANLSWFGPFADREASKASIDAQQVLEAMDDLDWLEDEVDPVWFGSTGPRDGGLSAQSLTSLRTRRAALMNVETGGRGVVAPAQPLGMDQSGAYLVLVRRPPGQPTRVPGREGYVAQDTRIVSEPARPPQPPRPSPPSRSPQRTVPPSSAGTEPGFHLGPILGAMFLSADATTFFSPMYGASVRRNPYSLFLGDSGAFATGGEGSGDRFRFGGVRYGQPTGVFFQLIAIDARRVSPERDVYTHRATGGTGGVGYQWAQGHLHGSITGGLGAFDAIVPGEAESKTAFGFSVTGHAGFTF